MSVSNVGRSQQADSHEADARADLVLVQPSPPAAGTRPAAGAQRAPTAADDAMREVWRRHENAIMSLAVKLTLGDRQRAEDIVQETLLRAWRHPEVVGDGTREIRSWLFTVTRRVAIDMWRARSRHETEVMDEQTDWPDPMEPIEQAVTAMDVRAALAKLTPEHRQVIVAMHMQGRSVADVAKALDIPEGTVKSRAYYGLRQLRRILAGSDALLPAGLAGYPAATWAPSPGSRAGRPRTARPPARIAWLQQIPAYGSCAN